MSKGRKPTKPQSKMVPSLIEQRRRRTGERELKQRFLIVCEDDKSAPNYFRALRSQFKLSATSIEVAGSKSRSQPKQVVDRAVARKEEAAKKESGTLPFDQVWCVIDGDYGDKIRNARAKAAKHHVKLAISTPCFEYWILLHFEESAASAVNCDAVVRLLRKKHQPSYEKGSCDFVDIVKRVDDASIRANRLRQTRLHDLPENHNPCSELYKLVNGILAS